jgi:predicted Rossmann-fold nucleotide-binding protein
LEGWNEQEAVRFFDKEKAGYGRQVQYTIPQEYAFVGSRNLNQFEPNVVGAFQKAAENAARAGYIVSTGAAKGADQLAAQSALSAGGAVRLSLPWNSYEKDWVNDISNTYPDRVAIETRLPTEGSPGMESVAKYHPHSENLPNSVRSLHARNHTILNPAQGRVAGVIALSRGSGGTEQAIRIANGENILVNRFSDPQSVPDRFL